MVRKQQAMTGKQGSRTANREGFSATPANGAESRSAPGSIPASPCTISRRCRCRIEPARVCRSSRLDHRHAGEGSWLRSLAAADAGEADRSCTAPGDRRRPGLASGSLGQIGNRFAGHASGLAAMLAVFAEFEREVLRDRVRAGLAHARQNGKTLGRPLTAGLKS